MPLEKKSIKATRSKKNYGVKCTRTLKKKKKKRKETTVIWNIALYFNRATRTERIFFNALPADEMVALLARQTVSFLFRLVRYTKFIHNGNSISKHCQQWSPIFFLRHFCFAFFFSRFTRGSPPRFDYESACHGSLHETQYLPTGMLIRASCWKVSVSALFE